MYCPKVTTSTLLARRSVPIEKAHQRSGNKSCIRSRAALTPKSLQNLLVGLADTEHDTGLGDQTLLRLLGDPEHLETLSVLGARVPDERRPRLDRLHVVRKDVESGAGNLLDRLDVAGKVGRQGLNEDVRCSIGICESASALGRVEAHKRCALGLGPTNGVGNVTGSAIRQVCVRADCQTPSAGDADDRLSDAPSRSTEVMTM